MPTMHLSFAMLRYFLVTTTYFLYGESIIYYFQQIILVDRVLLPFATHHRFISFVLYMIGKLLASMKGSAVSHDSGLGRVCVLCRQFEEGSVQAAIPSIWLDAYGLVACRLPESFHCQQHFGGSDLVLYSHFTRDLQWYLCLHLWILLGQNSPYHSVTKEDSGGLCRRLDLHNDFRHVGKITRKQRLACDVLMTSTVVYFVDEIQLHDLPCKGKAMHARDSHHHAFSQIDRICPCLPGLKSIAAPLTLCSPLFLGHCLLRGLPLSRHW